MELMSLADNPANLVNIFARGANDEYQIRMNEAASGSALSVFNRIAPTVNPQYLTEIYPGLTALPQMAEFNGEIQYGSFGDYQNSIVSREYARGYRVSYLQLRADQKNIRRLEIMPTKLANVAVNNRFYLLRDLLENNSVWEVDGANLFSSSHFFGDNDITVTVSSTTSMLEYDVQLIIDEITRVQSGYVDEQGNPYAPSFDISNVIFIVPPVHYPAFRRVQRQMMVPRGAADLSAVAAIDNIDSSTFELWPFPFLTGGAIYAIFADRTDGDGNPLGQSVPFLRTEFEPYQLNTGGTEQDPVWRNQKVLEVTSYGVEGVGILDASRAIKVTLSA